MFGMGFAEILIIVVIAILFLGPDKLPQTMVDIARFFRSAKRTIASAKSSIEEELHLEDIKREVDGYKNNLLDEKTKLQQTASFGSITDELETVVEMAGSDASESAPKTPKAERSAAKPEVVTFSKKKPTEVIPAKEENNDA